MPPVREKMRPWLVRQINSNSISGLSWVDQEKTMFCIPWKHAARHGWDMDKDACIFQKWAIHTGKYVVGQQCSPKTWKANFRCALNSLPDVVEVKGRSVQKGHEAMRVFQLLPESHKPRGRRAIPCKTKSKRKIKIESDSDEEEFSGFEFQQSSPSQNSTQESTVDSTVDDTLDNTVTSQHSDMKIEMDVPDWSQTVEVGAERYDFQVSPERSPDSTAYVFNSLTVMICSSSGEEKAFPVNDLSPSPGSHWSEASSGEELEELSLCTTLSPSPPGPEMWSASLPQTLFAYPDETPLL